MTTQSFTCTLTRWHKVTERLTKEYNQLCKAVKAALSATSVTEYLGVTQEERLVELRSQALAQMNRAFEFQDTITSVRAALGAANEREGVAAALAQYERISKRANLLSGLVEPATGMRFRIDELQNIKIPPGTNGFLSVSKTRIEIQMLEGSELARLTDLAKQATTAMCAQADQIAELNKSLLTLELPLDVVKVAGL